MMSTVKEYFYKNVSDLAETQHHIMHATFLLIDCSPPMDTTEIISNAQKVFKTLFRNHLTEQMEVERKEGRGGGKEGGEREGVGREGSGRERERVGGGGVPV